MIRLKRSLVYRLRTKKALLLQPLEAGVARTHHKLLQTSACRLRKKLAGATAVVRSLFGTSEKQVRLGPFLRGCWKLIRASMILSNHFTSRGLPLDVMGTKDVAIGLASGMI